MLNLLLSVAKGKYDEGAEIGSFFDAWGDIGGVLKEYGATGISQNPKDGRIQVDKGNVGAILNHLNTVCKRFRLNLLLCASSLPLTRSIFSA